MNDKEKKILRDYTINELMNFSKEKLIEIIIDLHNIKVCAVWDCSYNPININRK